MGERRSDNPKRVIVALADLACVLGSVLPTIAAAQATHRNARLYSGQRIGVADGRRRVAAAGGKMMEVAIFVDDPGAFTTAWSALQQFRRVPRERREDICAENNFDFLQYEVAPLPQAAKPEF